MRTSTPSRGQKLGALLAAPLMAATLAVGGLGLVTAAAAPAQAGRGCSGTLKNTTIDDDVQGESARYVKVQGSSIDGSVQTERARTGQHVVTSRVKGNIVRGAQEGQCRNL